MDDKSASGILRRRGVSFGHERQVILPGLADGGGSNRAEEDFHDTQMVERVG